MSRPQTLSDPAEINRLVDEQIKSEQIKYDSSKKCQNEVNDYGDCKFTSKEIIDALNRNEDGDAWLYIESYRDRFCFDAAAGCWYKWSGHYWEEDILNDAMRAIDTVIEIYGMELKRLSWEQQKEVINGYGNN
jgi:hypothetical protein